MLENFNKSEYYLGNPNLPNKNWKGEYTKEMVRHIKKSKANLLHFAENFFYIIDPDKGKVCIQLFTYQKRILRTLRDNRKVILLASRQCGKALDVNTPIKTPRGWSTMGELKTGDQVYGLNGRPCNVLKAHDIMHGRDCYEVEFDNGEKIVADADHNWFTQNRQERKKGINGSVKTTIQILESGVLYGEESNHRIPTCFQGIQGEETDKKRNEWDYIKGITKVESRPVRCITVDSEDSLYLCGRSLITTHNTTCLTIYALWISCFLDYQNIVIVANKEATAIEIFRRVRLAYEELPNWIKPGVKEYGKTSCEFDNGSRISISTTTGSAARGQSINCLLVDEMAFIDCVHGNTTITLRNKNTGAIYTESIENCMKMLSKTVITLSRKMNSNLHDQPLEFVQNSDYEILTPFGWKSFAGIAKYKKRPLLKIITANNKQIIVSHNHLFCCNKDTIFAHECEGRVIDTEDGQQVVVDVIESEEDCVYDVAEVLDEHCYYGNGIVNHNTHLLDEFWRSVFPTLSRSKKSKILIASTPNGTGNLFHRLHEGSEKNENGFVTEKVPWYDVPGRDEKWKQEQLKALGSMESFLQEFEVQFLSIGDSSIDDALFFELSQKCTDPKIILDDGHYKIWEEPDSSRVYVVGVDISEGVGIDASVIQVLDITDIKDIKQVAVYHNNQIPPLEFTNKLHTILKNWGSPLALIERNNCGAQVVDRLVFDIGYTKVVSYGAKAANRTRPQMGMIAHTNTKYKGVMNMRYFVNEIKCVTFRDINTLKEMKDFVRYPNGTWKAKNGVHDDRVMSLIYGLYILEKELTERYFDILELDEFGKPCSIQPMDFGITLFEDPTSIYTDFNIVGENNTFLTPVVFGMSGSEQESEIDMLKSEGWVPYV